MLIHAKIMQFYILNNKYKHAQFLRSNYKIANITWHQSSGGQKCDITAKHSICDAASWVLIRILTVPLQIQLPANGSEKQQNLNKAAELLSTKHEMCKKPLAQVLGLIQLWLLR